MKNFNLTLKRGAGTLFFFLFASRILLAQNNITLLPYNPGVTSFDSYDPSSQGSALATIPAGWSFSCTGTPAYNGRVTLIIPSTGGYYAYFPLLSSDFCLGGQRDANAGNITYNVNYTNNTGGLITTLVFSWTYEQWRFANNSGWSCYGTGALAGNATLATKNFAGSTFGPGSVAVPSFTLSGLSIANGASFGVAWTTTDDTNADNGVAIDDFSMSASSIASITIANGTVPTGTVYQTSTNNVLYRSDVTVSVTPTILNSAAFTTAGTYTGTNLTNLKLWYSTNSVFSPTATLLSTRTVSLSPGTKTFTGLSQTFPLGTGYLFLTADVACSATNNINVTPISASNFTFSNGAGTGSGFTAGGLQTMAGLSVAAVSSRSTCSGKNMPGITFTTFPSGNTVNWSNSNTGIGLNSTGSGNIASYAAPVTVSNQTGVITATASNGACIGNTVNFNIVVKSAGQASSIWTGVLSGDWEDSDNWTNCACTGVTNVTVASVVSPAFNPTLSTLGNLFNLTISPGAILNVAPSKTLNVRGNWLNHGTFVPQNNCVVFNGPGVQTIDGTSITTFNDLILNNAASLVLNTQQYVQGNIQLESGTFNTNNLLTLIANSTSSGRIGAINPNADIINNVTIQQLAPGGSTGWALLGSSIVSPLTIAGWNDNFAITCQNCPNGYNNNFTSIYSYNETIAGSYSAVAKYIPITNISDNILPGKGYWVYLGNNSPNTTDITFDVTGTVAKSSCLSCSSPVTIPLSFTSNNGISDDGWNLISNPLPSPISWTALRNGNANVDNAIYVYNTDLNGGLGGHTSYVNGISSNPSNGIGDNIAIHQGFYVHATAATQLTAGESIKVNSNPTFLRPAQVAKPVFRLVLKDSGGFEDMSTFYFEQGGSVNFQTDFDAYKLNFDETTTPYLGSVSGTVLTSINGLPELNSNFSIPVKAISPVTKNFVFSSLQSDFPNHVCVTLYDSYTGITTNLLMDDYSCMLYDTTTITRFTINFFTGSSVGTSSLQQPVCATPLGGFISAQGSGPGPWNYEWKSGNTVLKTSLNKNTVDSLSGLNGGNYTLKVSTVGQCDVFSPSFTLNTIISTDADFVPETFTTVLSNSGLVNFTNNSSNSVSGFWDFGDGSGTSTLPHPFYNYSSPGMYTVTLITESSTNCRDTAKHVIEVINDITSIGSLEKDQQVLLATLGSNQYALKLSFDVPTNFEVNLYDLKGALLKKSRLENISQTEHLVDLSFFSHGLYILNVTTDTKVQKTFKVMN